MLTVGLIGVLKKDWQTDLLKPVKDGLTGNTSDGVINSVNVVFWIALVVGAIVALLGFLGCCGAFCESAVLLYMFSAIMMIMIIIELVIGILAIVYKDRIKTDFTDPMLNSLAPNATSDNQTCQAFKSLQDTFVCCGLNGTAIESTIPEICSLKCPNNVTDGCLDVLPKKMVYLAFTAGIVVLVFMVLEFSAVIFACCLIRALKSGGLSEYHTV